MASLTGIMDRLTPLSVACISLLLMLGSSFLFEELLQPKRHRIFSKALLTDYAVIEESDFELTFKEILLDYKQSSDYLTSAACASCLRSGSIDGVTWIHNSARRADGTEAIYINASKKLPNGNSNTCGQVFALSLMKFLKNTNFLSRDVVILLSDANETSIKFISNLLQSDSISAKALNLPSNIQSVLNLEFEGEHCNNFHSFKFGVFGNQSLPFMDFVNALAKIADFHGLETEFENLSPNQLLPQFMLTAINQYVGHLNSFNGPLSDFKIDTVTVKASADADESEHESLIHLYKFMCSSIRSLSNAVEHFQHESAVYFPTTSSSYYELSDYLVWAILLTLPIALIAIIEIVPILQSSLPKQVLFSEISIAFGLYLKCIVAALFSVSVLRQFVSNVHSSNLAILYDIGVIFVVRRYFPKAKHARILGSVLIFIGCLVTIFTSFGSGIVLYTMSLCAIISISITNHLKVAELILLPSSSLLLYFKLALVAAEKDSFLHVHELLKNNHVVLLVQPGILLYHCQAQNLGKINVKN